MRVLLPKEDVAPKVCVFCKGKMPRNCSSSAVMQESWLEASLDFLNRYYTMNSEVLKVVQNLVAWQGGTKPLNLEVFYVCALLSSMESVVWQ